MDINNDINKEDVNDHRDPDHSKPWRISDFPGLTTPFRVGSKAIYDKYMALLNYSAQTKIIKYYIQTLIVRLGLQKIIL